jgi:hypothetical protein
MHIICLFVLIILLGWPSYDSGSRSGDYRWLGQSFYCSFVDNSISLFESIGVYVGLVTYLLVLLVNLLNSRLFFCLWLRLNLV